MCWMQQGAGVGQTRCFAVRKWDAQYIQVEHRGPYWDLIHVFDLLSLSRAQSLSAMWCETKPDPQ